MNTDLHGQFSRALASPAPDDMVDALNRTGRAVLMACRDHGPDTSSLGAV
jgi:hypothetical protein